MLIWANWVHTAVTRRKAVRQLMRSMNGTTLTSTSTDFLSPLPSDTPTVSSYGMEVEWEGSHAARLHLAAVRGHQVHDLDGDLVDVVVDAGRLARQQREREEAEERHADAEPGAVERLADALGELGGLLA